MRPEGGAVWLRAARAWLPVGLFLAAGACEPSLTSVGSWTDDAGAGHYLEAEDGALSGGFVIGQDSAASAGRYISPPVGVSSENAPGPARAVYEFSIGTAGTYRIWGRIRSPTAENNRFWIQVDDNAPIKWRISTGDIWYSGRLSQRHRLREPHRFSARRRSTPANCRKLRGRRRLGPPVLHARPERCAARQRHAVLPAELDRDQRRVPAELRESGRKGLQHRGVRTGKPTLRSVRLRGVLQGALNEGPR